MSATYQNERRPPRDASHHPQSHCHRHMGRHRQMLLHTPHQTNQQQQRQLAQHQWERRQRQKDPSRSYPQDGCQRLPEQQDDTSSHSPHHTHHHAHHHHSP